MSVTVALFAMVWHAEAFVQENVLDVTLRVRYNMAKVWNMTRYYSLASVKRKEISKSIQVTCQCKAAAYNTVQK